MFPTGRVSQHKQEVLPVGIWEYPNQSRLQNMSVITTSYFRDPKTQRAKKTNLFEFDQTVNDTQVLIFLELRRSYIRFSKASLKFIWIRSAFV